MITHKQFKILYEVLQNPKQVKRYYAEKLDFSLGSFHEISKQLEEANLIKSMQITEDGLRVLQPYKVENALIMAAGMSTRMAPLSLEKPKGLMLAKGDILIERMIEQLQEAGITDITIVLGYMKEKFFYLEDKYNVKFLINEDYYRYNNTSTLMVAEKELKNTYICFADLLFTRNIFQAYEYRPFLAAVFFPERVIEHGLVCTKENRVKSINYIAENQWCMYGHIYYDRAFSNKYMEILKKEYTNPLVRTSYLQDILLNNMKEFEFYTKKYPQGIIYEFDSLSDLSKYDPDYISNTNFNVIANITKALQCSQKSVTNIEPIKNSNRNLFLFEVDKTKYFYEYPIDTNILNEESEFHAFNFLKEQGFEHSTLYIDDVEGWKILEFKAVPNPISYDDAEIIQKTISYLKKIHAISAKYTRKINIWNNIEALKFNLEQSRKTKFDEFSQLYNEVHHVYSSLNKSENLVFSHGSALISNFYICNKQIELSQWKNVGMATPAFDLASLLCFSSYSIEEIEQYIQFYYGEKTIPSEELKHYKDYFIVTAFYWYLTLLQKDTEQIYVGKELYNCYKHIKKLLSA